MFTLIYQMKEMRKQQKQRLIYLNKIYELSDGSNDNPTPSLKSGDKLGFIEKLSRKIEKYLEEEGLIEIYGNISDGNYKGEGIWITHKGIIEAEKYQSDFDEKNDYEVVLSFAGEKRDYVEKVAKILHNNNVKVFYDNFEDVKIYLWGKELPETFKGIYGGNARYCVMFISKEYANKMWTNEERRSALSKAIREKQEYILPARFDDTKISGIRETVGYINLSEYAPNDFGKLILKKLGVPVDEKLDIRVSVVAISIVSGISGVLSSTTTKNFIEIKAQNYDKASVFLKPPRIRIRNETGYIPISQNDVTSVSILGGIQKLEPGNSWEVSINPARYGAENIDKIDYVAFIDKLDREYKSSSEEMSEAIEKWKTLEKDLHS